MEDYVLTANYRRGDQTFTSVTGFYGYHFGVAVAANEAQNNGPALFTVDAPEHYRQFSQELRVVSSSGHAIDYLAGVYFQTDQLAFMQSVDYPFIALPAPLYPLGSQANFSQGEHDYAAFGSLTWNITDDLRVIGGIRGTYVRKGYDWNEKFGNATAQYGGVTTFPGALCTTSTPATGLQAKLGTLGLGAACSFNGWRQDSDWLPSAKLEYKFAPDVMGYLSFSQGFKAGGFNGARYHGRREQSSLSTGIRQRIRGGTQESVVRR